MKGNIMSDETKTQNSNNDGEFSSKSILAGLLRTGLFIGSFFLVIIGTMIYAFGLKIAGNIMMMLAVLMMGYNTYLSFKDKSTIKWFNIGVKIILLLVYIFLLYSFNFGV